MAAQALTIKRFRPKSEHKPPEPVVDEPPLPLGETDVVLQDILPKKCRVPIPEPRAETAVAKTPPAIVMNYPRTGKRVLPEGTTTIGIKQATVQLADGTSEKMYATRRVDTCRCFAMYTDRMIDIRLTMGGGLLFTSSVFPAWFRKLDMLEFDAVEITCTEPTTFYIVMSEQPDGVPEHHPERWLSPRVSLGYNAAEDNVEIRKVVNGVTLNRLIDDPDVADKTVVKWVEYGAWTPA